MKHFIPGCNLSPLLFCLFINQLGLELNATGLGIDLDQVNISSIWFADDLVLFGKNKDSLDKLMTQTRTFFKNHHLNISESKSKILHHDAKTGKTSFSDANNPQLITLDNVVAFKYLGIYVSSSPYSLFKNFNETVKKKARSYVASVLSMAKTGPDRSNMAYTTWTCIALPSILYGAEVMPLTQDTITTLEQCQNQIARFMLQLPKSSAKVSTNLDAGLRPVWCIIAEKAMQYAYNTMRKPVTNWAKKALNKHLTQGSKIPIPDIF